jgi:hypothetical protein
MTKYKCELCYKTFKKKDHYTQHINRKIKCTENQYNNNCIYCQKKFTTKGNVTRHIRNNCNIYKKIQNEKQDIFNKLIKLEQENKELKDENIKIKTKLKQKKSAKIILSNNTINSNNNITNNGIINNITIVAFGKEKIDNISDKEILNAVSRGFNTAEHLTKTIHFNNKYPEYHNVYIPSIKESYAMTFDGNEWKLVKKKDIIDNIYDDKKYFVESNLEDFAKSLSPYKIKTLENWLESDKNDDKNIKNIKKNIELLLYNERKKPLLLKEKIESN